MPFKTKNYIIILSLALLSLLIVQPLFAGLPRGHDTLLHFYRIAQLNSLFSQGILYSRWAPDLVYGYGYPLLNFYPPLSSYLMTILYWLAGQNAILATTASFGLALILAGIGMFLAGRSLAGPWGGLLAAAAYCLAPYLLYQTYERGSISTALAMSFFPWVIWAFIELARKGTLKWIAIAALMVFFTLASHTSASILFLPGAALVAITAAIMPGQNKDFWRHGWKVGLALAAGMGLAAFIWVPALTEYPLTLYKQALVLDQASFQGGFAPVWQWPGLILDGAINSPLPRTPGLMQMTLAIGALFISTIHLIFHNDTKWLARLVLVSALLGLAYTFMATTFSSVFWQNLPFLMNLQYPWRFIDVGTLFVALACVGLTLLARPRLVILLGTLAVIVMFANAVPYLYPPRWHGLPAQPTLADASEAQSRWGILGLTSWGEYLPATATWKADKPAFAGSDEGALLAVKLEKASIGDGRMVEVTGNSLSARMSVELPKAAQLVFDTYYYPGWRASVDGIYIPVGYDTRGLISVAVPAGSHVVTLAFSETWQRWLADGISLATVAALLAGLVVTRMRKKLVPKQPES
ncbi:MAG: hypothetical protein ACYC6L_14575, partial [Anaerolineae bacterium]